MTLPLGNSKKKIISLDIDTITFNEAINRIVNLAKNKISGYVCFANAHMTIEAYQEPQFAKDVNSATFVFPDGVPIVKSLKVLYGLKQERVAGMDVMPALIREAGINGLNLYFFGTSPEVLGKIKAKTNELYPQANIVGLFSPPFNETWNDDLFIDQINRSKADLVFVALGCPKQEKWMAMHSRKIHAVMLGVGAAFPVYAGIQGRAPLWVRNLSLEWVHRMMQEPGRLIKRYAKTNALFLYLLFKEFGAKNNRQHGGKALPK